MDDNGWQESREAVARGLQWRLKRELLDNPSLTASVSHIEESIRSILEARSEREYEIAYQAFLLGCVWPDHLPIDNIYAAITAGRPSGCLVCVSAVWRQQ